MYMQTSLDDKWYFLFWAIVVAVSLRSFLPLSGDILGHNWDWTFPYLPEMFQNLYSISTSLWLEPEFGYNVLLLAEHLIPNTLLSLLARVFSPGTAIMILLISVLFFSFLFFKQLLNYLIGRHVIQYLPATLYSLSPFLFNDVIGGSWYMWISYAFAPLFFRSILQFLEKRSSKHLLVWLISSVFVISSTQDFVLMEIILILFLLYQIVIAKQSMARIAGGYVISHVFLVLVNMYWLLPFVYFLGDFTTTFIGTAAASAFSAVKTATQTVLNIFLLVGYLDRNMYAHVLPSVLYPFFIFLVLTFWACFALFFIRTKTTSSLKRGIMPWFLIFVVLLVLVTGANPPFGEWTIRFFERIPFMTLYRSPQHLVFAAAFLIPMLFSFALQYFFDMSKRRWLVISISGIVIMGWVSGWWYTGDIGHQTLLAQRRDHIDRYQLSPELISAYRWSESDPLIHRLLFLPTVSSPLYLSNAYQQHAQGGQAEFSYLQNPTFSAERSAIGRAIDESFCLNRPIDFLSLLSLTNTRYVGIRFDILPWHTSCKDRWYVMQVQVALDRLRDQGILRQVVTGEQTILYQLADTYFVPTIFVPVRFVKSNRSSAQLPFIVSRDTYSIGDAVYFNSMDSAAANISTLLSGTWTTPRIQYKKISRTKYRVRISGAKENFPLILSQNFDPGWKVYIIPTGIEVNGGEFVSLSMKGSVQNDNLPAGKWYETYRRQPLSEQFHFSANGFANAWWIDLQTLREQGIIPSNSDAPGTIEIILEFWPQRLLYAGWFISGGVLIFVCIWFLFEQVKQRKHARAISKPFK